MTKYIKYDEAFINKATEACASDAAAMIKIIDLLHHYPAADVSEVVRCKECKHFIIDTFKRTMCNRTFTMFEMNGNDFCSYGER